eukprot:NODE_204_length_14945_cov_0.251313.p7 type:complete len:250 gc:universal NODE_204_length_14945_cov_0.251313:5849-6598(+)
MLRRILGIFDKIAPKELQPAWDNTGILVEPFKSNESNKVMLTIDLTASVLDEAIKNEIEVIVAYHPIIFKGIKEITLDNPKQKILASCIHHGIGVFCPHTRLDAIDGGINDWLLDPFIGEITTPEDKLGRVIKLASNMSGNAIVERVKMHLNLEHLQAANFKNFSCKSIAVCAGSGGSILAHLEADCYITGELDHHSILGFVEKNKMVIVTNHTNTERGYLAVLKRKLTELGISDVAVSINDRDPLAVV